MKHGRHHPAQKAKLSEIQISRPIGFNSKDWGRALEGVDTTPQPVEKPAPPPHSKVPPGWWQSAFADRPPPSEQRGHPCGETEMLMLVAYDICEPRRLRHVMHHCEDYGIRVQYSIFECRLPSQEFDQFWQELLDLINPKEDRLVAYRICANCAQDIRTAGTMLLSADQKVVAYVF